MREVRSERRTRLPYVPTDALLLGGLMFGLLPQAPILAQINQRIGVPAQGPLLAAWFLLVALGTPRRGVRAGAALLLTAALAWIGAVSAFGSHDPSATRTYVGGLLFPLAVFLGLQLVRDREVMRARQSLRVALFAVVALQVLYYIRQAGWHSVLSPSFVIGHHTDVHLWEDAGKHVLANPNNAAVIFCTAFAWAVGERAIGNPGRLSWLFVVVSGAAVWVTGSRGAYLTAGFVVLCAALAHSRTRGRAFRILVAAAGIYAAVKYWLDRFAPESNTEASFSTRWQTRMAALPDVFSHPFGHGPGSTATALQSELGSVTFVGTDTQGATSHDLFLNWGICVGWLGLLALVVLLWVALRGGWRTGRLLAVLPLLAFLLSGESTGVDVLNPTNAAWAVTLLALVGLCWRGGVVQAQKPQANTTLAAAVTCAVPVFVTRNSI